MIVSLLAVLMAAAQQNAAPWITETLHSKTLGDRTIYVALPDEYANPTSRFPVLICLDGNDTAMLRLWIAQAAYVAGSDRGVPPVIAVGIVNGADRLHDMTPKPVGSSVADFKTGGGADAFADFIINEVLPLVRRKYRTLPTIVITGHSAGGLFALYAAATRPGAFQGTVATSPALWYNDALPAREFADAIAQSTSPQRIFAASGGVDEADIDTTTQRFYHRLDSLRSATVAVGYQRYPDQTHSMTALGFADGWRFVFERVSIRHVTFQTLPATADSAAIAGALDASERSYAAAARELRLPEQLPEDMVNSFGYRLLGRGKTWWALRVFRQNVDRYPGSVNVYDSYGDGLVAAGDTAAAIEQFRQAVKVGRRTGAPVAAETHEKLARFTAAMSHRR
jgi:predicted alpha/beta superfamily hydrolase